MRVKDLMTTNVLTVRVTTQLKDAARLLAEHRISGLPVVDDDGRVLGVLSEGDILYKETGMKDRPGFFERLLSGPTTGFELKLAARTVDEAMSAPAVTIGPTRPVTVAATTMIDESVNRLPVVDHEGRLVGIVTRADLVRAFVRTDAEIEHEIREDVIRQKLWLEPDAFHVEVVGGEARLSGEVETQTDAEMIPTLVQRVPGVVAVLSKLRWREENGRLKGSAVPRRDRV
jgi:CBS domain-containing protein